MIPAGIVIALVGLAILAVALRGDRARPRNVAMLIAGMMVTVLGGLMAGFAYAYDHTAPLDMNTGVAR